VGEKGKEEEMFNRIRSLVVAVAGGAAYVAAGIVLLRMAVYY